MSGPGARIIGGGASRFRGVSEKPRNARRTLSRLLGDFARERMAVLAMFALAVVETAAVIVAPLLIGRAVDAIARGASGTADAAANAGPPGAAAIVGALAAVYLASALLAFGQAWIVAAAGQRMVAGMRASYFRKLGSLPLAFFDARAHGDVMSRLTNDCDAVGQAFSQTAVQLAAGVASVAGSLAMMIVLSPVLALVTLGLAPLVALLSRVIARRTRPLFRAQQDALGRLNGLVEESASGLDAIRAFGREDLAVHRFETVNGELMRSGVRAQIWTGFLMPMLNVIGNLGYTAIALVGGLLAARGAIGVGVIASFLVYSRQFIRPLNEMANLANTLMSALAGAERVFEVLDQADETPDREAALPADSLRGDTRFDSVGFSYVPGRPALSDADLEAAAGSVTAIVGPTGAGKTTIVNLLARFYDADSGVVSMDGVDVRDYRRAEYRGRFGVVLQDSYLFPGTVRDNVRYARPCASDAEVLAACAAACALPFIERLGAGLDTELGENGGAMSHGERQLLAIARAALASPSVLILDEATGTLDTRTEIHVQRGLRALMEGRTTFVIAHRLSTIRDADRILVVDGGRIVERGTHAGLMAARGLYHGMFRAQLTGDFE